jgi:hypothetical protein
MLLQGSRHFSDGHVGTSTGLKARLRRPRYYLYRAQGTSLPATLAHSYTPFTAGHLLVSIKGDVQGLPEGGRGEEREERATYEHTDARRRRAEAGRVGETR